MLVAVACTQSKPQAARPWSLEPAMLRKVKVNVVIVIMFGVIDKCPFFAIAS
jgi:hypothetical protein